MSISFFDRRILLFFVLSKIITIFALLFFFYYVDTRHNMNLSNRWYSGLNIWHYNLDRWYYGSQENEEAIYVPFANWDAQNYLLLADKGYAYLRTQLIRGPKYSPAFFPLFPLSIRVLIFYYQKLLPVSLYCKPNFLLPICCFLL